MSLAYSVMKGRVLASSKIESPKAVGLAAHFDTLAVYPCSEATDPLRLTETKPLGNVRF